MTPVHGSPRYFAGIAVIAAVVSGATALASHAVGSPHPHAAATGAVLLAIFLFRRRVLAGDAR